MGGGVVLNGIFHKVFVCIYLFPNTLYRIFFPQKARGGGGTFLQGAWEVVIAAPSSVRDMLEVDTTFFLS